MADNQNPGGTAVATREPRKTLTESVNALMTSAQARAYIEPFLPPGTDIQRVAATLLLAMKKDESGKLRKCSPESLLLGVAKILQWGAELGTTAYLIPFGTEATAVRDYKYLAELAAVCGYPMEGKAVREGDDFEYEFGLKPILRHVPAGKKGAAVTHAYVIIHPPHGAAPIFDVMTAEQVEAVRQKYSKQWKTGPLLDWYAVKTVIRRATKLLPKDPKLARFLEAVREEEVAELGGEPVRGSASIADEQRDVSEVEGADIQDFQDDRDLVE